MLTVTDRGLTFIARWEGLRLSPYNDAAGNATIGYGHLIHMGNVTPSDDFRYRHFDGRQAVELLRADVGDAVAAINRFVTPPIVTPHRFDALCSFVFNLGPIAFERSELCSLLNNGVRGERAADELLRWDHAGGRVLEGLRLRRAAERTLYLHGSYDA